MGDDVLVGPFDGVADLGRCLGRRDHKPLSRFSAKVTFCGRSGMPVRFIYPDEESEYAHSGLVVRNFGGTSAQTCLHDCAAEHRIQRTPLALACASAPPRRARPNTRHRSSGNGTLLA
jgi:hypothetical protein